MEIRLRQKIFLTMLAAMATVVLCMYLVMRWSFDRGFLKFVHTMDQARLETVAGRFEEAYATEGSWQFLKDDPQRLFDLLRPLPPDGADGLSGQAQDQDTHRASQGHRHSRSMTRGHDSRSGFMRRVVLLDENKNPVVGPVVSPRGLLLRPILHDGKMVGYLGMIPPRIVSDVRQLQFAREQKHTYALIALVVVILAGLISFPMADRMVRRIRSLASATHLLASGKFDTRVPSDSSDEIGQLSRDFNTLAMTLEKNETARRQWVADISHELRTPLSVLRGEIEALQDGVRKPNPEVVGALHGEVMKLGRLVDDLFELSLSDLGALTYRRTETDLGRILRQTIEPFQNEFEARGINLKVEAPPDGSLLMFADPDRLRQLFSNILENSLKYTEGGGRLNILAERKGKTANVSFEDSGPGVPESELGKLFDRLYRVEGSRSRATGGAGLGLAICRNIVEAHNGDITAFSSTMGGLGVKMEIPLDGFI
ncbi:MAG: ATP-binding protein [Syntrophorhabdaceae bacterium]|nr:ATP-binding protein [Syntrophorhabdaceae bacterium]